MFYDIVTTLDAINPLCAEHGKASAAWARFFAIFDATPSKSALNIQPSTLQTHVRNLHAVICADDVEMWLSRNVEAGFWNPDPPAVSASAAGSSGPMVPNAGVASFPGIHPDDIDRIRNVRTCILNIRAQVRSGRQAAAAAEAAAVRRAAQRQARVAAGTRAMVAGRGLIGSGPGGVSASAESEIATTVNVTGVSEEDARAAAAAAAARGSPAAAAMATGLVPPTAAGACAAAAASATSLVTSAASGGGRLPAAHTRGGSGRGRGRGTLAPATASAIVQGGTTTAAERSGGATAPATAGATAPPGTPLSPAAASGTGSTTTPVPPALPSLAAGIDTGLGDRGRVGPSGGVGDGGLVPPDTVAPAGGLAAVVRAAMADRAAQRMASEVYVSFCRHCRIGVDLRGVVRVPPFRPGIPWASHPCTHQWELPIAVPAVQLGPAIMLPPPGAAPSAESSRRRAYRRLGRLSSPSGGRGSPTPSPGGRGSPRRARSPPSPQGVGRQRRRIGDAAPY